MTDRFAICIESGEYEGTLLRWKVYPVLDDADAESHHELRVVDESGEDYLYPRDWFHILDLPAPVASLFRAAHQQ